MKLQKKWFIPLLTVLSSSTFAQAFLQNDESLRSDLAWLNQQGVIQVSTSTWPLSTDALEKALAHAVPQTKAQRLVLESVQKTLEANHQLATVQLKAGTTNNQLPANFGAADVSQYQAGLTVQKSAEQWDVHIQGNAESKQRIDNGNKFNLDGSYVAGKLWNQWVSFGAIPVYWGPGHDGSLIRGDATRPVVGFLAQRAEQDAFETKWLSWLGPWQYQLFAGQLQKYTAVPNTRLLGMRVTIQPLPYLELGASRTFQIGGDGQPDSAKAYWNAFVGKDNNCSNAGCVNDQNASNQLGGFDARLNLQPLLQLPISIYGQMIGEDESGKLPSRNTYLAGADYSSSYKQLPYQVYAEWADTRTSGKVMGYTYNHHQYTDGYYQYGYPLGHSTGGDSEMYSVGGNIQVDPINRITGRILYAKVNQSNSPTDQAFSQDDTLKALELGWSNQLKTGVIVQVNGWVSDSDHLARDHGASIRVKFPLSF
ncbi:capsule assembly Wzi family protein [Acinetobacter apis]|uniref:Capsule assembly protein Wzi n=1 Tax=Acinetobacter apis TaxID=1229165 RepID=A0A217EHG3_9GAMM|nr:capsule assembly Wzi family protein [Acinetobacter apis]SNQ29945.1 Capsule assembly protein Wzi [Acinetobacter apis]